MQTIAKLLLLYLQLVKKHSTVPTYQVAIALITLISSSCNSGSKTSAPQTSYQKDSLPKPYHTNSSVRFSKVVGWPKNKTPIAPEGFTVSPFADGLNNPRWIYQAPNGDIFVAESNTILSGLKKLGARLHPRIKTQRYGTSANRITMFSDVNKDGIYERRSTFLDGLNQPFGMLYLNNAFYVANTDALVQYPYKLGDLKVSGAAKKIVDLPAGGYNNHWTRNIISNRNGTKIYITIGSGSNVGENGMINETRRANILEVNPDGAGERVYASGLRNPVGVAWAPGTETLWTVVNERDKLGDELVPDYLTAVQTNGFYGWPYAYFGQHEDPRLKDQQRPDLIAKSILPDVSLGAHTASLGLAFYDKTTFPLAYHNGAFIGQHGSWNRSALSGYKVVFVPFKNGRPTGNPVDFLTGFIKDISRAEVYGRPVGVTFLNDGSMLVADDASGIIWQVAVKK
jgi:glucose/arabinose dehydrogenase